MVWIHCNFTEGAEHIFSLEWDMLCTVHLYCQCNCSFLTSKVEVLKLARLLSGIHLCFPKELLELLLRHTAAEDDSKATFPVMSVRRHFDK